MLTAEEFLQRMERVEQLTQELARSADPASAQAATLLRTVFELERAGMQRMLSIIREQGELGTRILERFAQDDLVRSLLLLHELHPIDLRSRLLVAVEQLRPLIQSYGGDVVLETVGDQCVVLALDLDDATSLSPRALVKQLLEDAILVAAPDVTQLEIVESPPGTRRLPVLPILDARPPTAKMR